ncbi:MULTISPECIES: hypothetical protein [unclassified Clostridium]|jgi:hypothetical protein|uniref:hypothetical protein n=1 Tax=unclassified Clostridium TaxID=2614128 RepID=UPI0025BB8C16|nr:hypothetical protein [Clostridium sp.]MCI6692708.1 hypothetical protein [Clostridium sp.]MDY2632713.1 hypothetical protein [Clostridium sp.]MDY6228191.1 hypothetical protein [Clostridium sp.]
MDTIIYSIVLDYLNKKVTSDLKDEFINASVHFNINNDIYTKYSSVEIEYMLSKISDSTVIDYVELCSVCGYILYRSIENNELTNDDRIEALQIILEVRNDISNYLRGVIQVEELYERLVQVTRKFGLTNIESKKLIDILDQ